MAFQMNYTTIKDANYPSSYWRLGWYQIDRSSRIARLRFDCYFNQTARETGAETNVLECKNYKVTDSEFTTAFEVNGDIRQLMYDYASSCLEGEAPEAGMPDTRLSFFHNATIV